MTDDALNHLEADIAGKRKRAPAKQWYDTEEAARYIGGKATAESVRKLVQRGRLRPDSPAGTRGLRAHRFHRSTLDAYLGKTG